MMNMNNELRIRTLTERFLNGETTLKEEQWLAQCYRSHRVPEDLLALRPMFMGLEAISLEHERAGSKPARKAVLWRRWVAVAACVAILLAGGGTLLWQRQQNECVAYIYGKKCTDRDVVMKELQRSITEVTADDGNVDVERQLNDLFEIN